MALSQNFTAIAWTGFSIFSVAWIVMAIVILGFWIAGIRAGGAGSTATIKGKQFKYRQQRGSFTGTRGSIVLVVSIVVFWMVMAFMYLSQVVDTTGKSTFILRAGETFDPFNCTFIGELSSFPVCDDALVDDGTCAILIRWMWYVPVFALFSLMYTYVFGFTSLSTILHVIGSITLAFGLAVGTYTGNPTSYWTAFALAGFGALLAIAAMVWAWFDVESSALFVTSIRFEGIEMEGFPKTGEYSQFMNPFARDKFHLLFVFIVGAGYLWYPIAWAIGPAGAGVSGFGIINESATLLATDFLFFGLVPFFMVIAFFFLQPGVYRTNAGHEAIAYNRAWERFSEEHKRPPAAGDKVEMDNLTEYYRPKNYEPHRSISRIQSKHSKPLVGRKRALVL